MQSGWRGQVAAILAAALCAVALNLLAPRIARPEGVPAVSVALILAADVSGSITRDQIMLQREGAAAALLHPAVLDAIAGTAERRIIVAVVEWDDDTRQSVVLPWTVIAGESDAEAASAALLGAPIRSGGGTSLAGMLRFASVLLAACPCRPARQVVDVSSDGDHPPPGPERAALLAAGVTINAILIVPPAAADRIRAFYEADVIGGPGRFLMVADGYETFAFALRAKLVREVAGWPTAIAGAR